MWPDHYFFLLHRMKFSHPNVKRKMLAAWPCETIAIARPISNNYTKINENIENVYNVVGTDKIFGSNSHSHAHLPVTCAIHPNIPL